MQLALPFHLNVAHDGGLDETPYSYEAHFRVKPSRVQKSFSFEELQSGSCFQFFDEDDIQFYRVYGQAVFVPGEDLEYVSHGHPYPLSPLHYPYQQQQRSAFQHKPYASAGSLCDYTSRTATHCTSHSELPARSYHQDAHQPSTPSSTPMACSSGLASDNLPGGTAPAYESLSMAQHPPLNTSYADHSNSTSVADGSDSQLGHPTLPPILHMTVPSQAYPTDQTQSPPPRTQQQAQPSQVNPHQHHGKGGPLDKKPALACFFCRGRKIACGPPLPESKDKTCNQCARRHLKCEYPLKSRRGIRKRKSIVPRAGSVMPAVLSPPRTPGSGVAGGSNRIKRKKSPEGPATTTKVLYKGRK